MSADLVPTIGADEARSRLARVRAHVDQAAADLTALYAGRAWLALGHDSWESLCDAELGGVRIALPRSERREVHAEMREAGLSIPAIAAATGVSVGTVHADLSNLKGPERIVGTDGVSRPARVTTTEKVERLVDLDTGEVVDAAYAAGVAAADAVDLPDLPLGPSFMTRFLTSLHRAGDVLRFSPLTLADAADPDEWHSFLAFVDSINTFAESARAARPGLRSVKG